MVATVLTLQHDKHNTFLKTGISEMIYHAGYLNVKVICKDGTLYHNRMTIGLLFPGIRDESVAIIPDMTVQEISEEINKLFGASDDSTTNSKQDSSGDETEESVIILNGDEKLSVSEVTDELFNSEDDFVKNKESKETDQNEKNKTKHQKSQKKRPKSKRKPRQTETFADFISDKSLHEEEEFIENISSVNQNSLKTFNNNPPKVEPVPIKIEASSSKMSSSKNKESNLMKEASALRSKEVPFKRARGIKAAPLMFEELPLKRPRHLVRCQKCPNCKIENCGDCHACLNMRQFGGTGSLKKACMVRPACLERNKDQDKSETSVKDGDKNDTSAKDGRENDTSAKYDKNKSRSKSAKKDSSSALADKDNESFAMDDNYSDNSGKEKSKKSGMPLRERRKKSGSATTAKAVVVTRVEDETIPLVEEVQGGVYVQELLSDE